MLNLTGCEEKTTEPEDNNVQNTGWIIQNSGTNQPLHGISCADANNCTAVGSYGTIVRTTDGGESWIDFILYK